MKKRLQRSKHRPSLKTHFILQLNGAILMKYYQEVPHQVSDGWNGFTTVEVVPIITRNKYMVFCSRRVSCGCSNQRTSYGFSTPLFMFLASLEYHSKSIVKPKSGCHCGPMLETISLKNILYGFH